MSMVAHRSPKPFVRVRVLLPLPKRNDNFRQEDCRFFFVFLFALCSFLSSLKLSFPGKREKRKEKKCFNTDNVDFVDVLCYDMFRGDDNE